MLSMKRDMSGGAAVLATMAALRDVGCPVRVIGLVPAAENAIGGAAMRPGDVIRHYGGRTSEVNNTDAEGRLVMADAMAYAVAELKPDVLVDIATLTGAMKVALGQGTGGYFANDEAPRRPASPAASAYSGELLWRMPLVRRLRGAASTPRSPTATTPPAAPGAITAALFLQHFTGDVPWAHIDFASIAEAPAERYEWTEGPTGFGPAAAARLARLGGPARRDRVMKGLTVRWSLADGRATASTAELAAYVADTSHARFTGMAGLQFKTWRSVPGRVVRGQLRLRVRRGTRRVPGDVHRRRAPSRRSRRSSAPRRSLIEPCDIVAIAEGWDGFTAAPRA